MLVSGVMIARRTEKSWSALLTSAGSPKEIAPLDFLEVVSNLAQNY